MVFVFGVDLPLVELVLAFSIITFIVLVEVSVIMVILLYQIRHSKEITSMLERVSKVMLNLEEEELKALEKTGLKKKHPEKGK